MVDSFNCGMVDDSPVGAGDQKPHPTQKNFDLRNSVARMPATGGFT